VRSRLHREAGAVHAGAHPLPPAPTASCGNSPRRGCAGRRAPAT